MSNLHARVVEALITEAEATEHEHEGIDGTVRMRPAALRALLVELADKAIVPREPTPEMLGILIGTTIGGKPRPFLPNQQDEWYGGATELAANYRAMLRASDEQ